MYSLRKTQMFGGEIWYDANLAGEDAGYSMTRKFINEHYHKGWDLSIYNTSNGPGGGAIMVECPIEEMPQIVSYIYNLEHACPMLFIGENPVAESYVVGMELSMGRINCPGYYKAENGKLVERKMPVSDKE